MRLHLFLYTLTTLSTGHISYLHKERHPETRMVNYHVWTFSAENIQVSRKKQATRDSSSPVIKLTVQSCNAVI